MPISRPQKRSAGIEATGIDLRRLRYFLAVCDHGGFLRAAQAIGVAQSALTRQIKLLEQEIGQHLLERDVRGARPSEAGRFLVTRSRRHLEGLDGALRDLWLTFAVTTGQVTLGICPSIAVKAIQLSEERIHYAILPFQQEVASGVFALADISHSGMCRTVSFVASDAPPNPGAVKQIAARAFERARELKAKLPAVF